MDNRKRKIPQITEFFEQIQNQIQEEIYINESIQDVFRYFETEKILNNDNENLNQTEEKKDDKKSDLSKTSHTSELFQFKNNNQNIEDNNKEEYSQSKKKQMIEHFSVKQKVERYYFPAVKHILKLKEDSINSHIQKALLNNNVDLENIFHSFFKYHFHKFNNFSFNLNEINLQEEPQYLYNKNLNNLDIILRNILNLENLSLKKKRLEELKQNLKSFKINKNDFEGYVNSFLIENKLKINKDKIESLNNLKLNYFNNIKILEEKKIIICEKINLELKLIDNNEISNINNQTENYFIPSILEEKFDFIDLFY